MKLYAIKYREKFKSNKEERYTAIFMAENEDDLSLKIKQWMENDCPISGGIEVDKRTITWAGHSIPLSDGREPFIMYANLEELC